MDPVRAGFFFREGDGSIHAAESYREFALDPLPVKPVPVAPPPIRPEPVAPAQAHRAPIVEMPAPKPQPVAEVPGVEIAPPPHPAKPDTVRLPVDPPNFTTVLQAGSRREWALLAVLAGLGLGAAGYKTQEQWLPRLLALARRAPSAPAEAPAAPAIGLSAVD